jgi:hypothetical protein
VLFVLVLSVISAVSRCTLFVLVRVGFVNYFCLFSLAVVAPRFPILSIEK